MLSPLDRLAGLPVVSAFLLTMPGNPLPWFDQFVVDTLGRVHIVVRAFLGVLCSLILQWGAHDLRVRMDEEQMDLEGTFD